jgi:hypothetical protein
MDTLIIAFIAWIVAHTGLATPEPPVIVFVPPHQMARTYYGVVSGQGEQHQMARGDQDATDSDEARGLQAFYDRANATIYLPETWRPTDLRDQSTLVHELVHHVQNANHVAAPCAAALERQAYQLQVLWLRQQGVAAPYALLGTDEFSVLVFSMCPPAME